MKNKFKLFLIGGILLVSSIVNAKSINIIESDLPTKYKLESGFIIEEALKGDEVILNVYMDSSKATITDVFKGVTDIVNKELAEGRGDSPTMEAGIKAMEDLMEEYPELMNFDMGTINMEDESNYLF